MNRRSRLPRRTPLKSKAPLRANREHEWRCVADGPPSFPAFDLFECDRCDARYRSAVRESLPPGPCPGLKQHSELGRKTGLSRRERIRPRNPERRERMSGKVFGALCDRVRRERCCVWDGTGCEGDVAAHHVRSRGAGHGDRLEDGTGNVAPLCHKHHREVHQYGRITFEEIHDVDLADVARKIGETA